MVKPKEQRRYMKRTYDPMQIRELFKVPIDEVIFDLCYDKNNNCFVLRTLKSWNEEEGDI